MIVNEIFHSIQGESTRAGLPCVFVRLTGCPLRCVYCDTAHAFHEGAPMTVGEVAAAVDRYDCPFVTITGGEPLVQEEVFGLIRRLIEAGYDVQIETSGAVDISRLDPNARVILDIKTPGSGMLEEMDWDNLSRLKAGDEIKFVLTGREDYEWARDVLSKRRIPDGVHRLLSPAHGTLDPRRLADWMKEDSVRARLHLQIHKYIWGEAQRGV